MIQYFRYIIACFVLMVTVGVLAVSGQTRVIRGTVIDDATNETMIGVNVIERNKNDRALNGTVTDINGNFMIKVSTEGKTELVFSFISYKSEVIPIKDQKNVTIRLKSNSEEIEDIIITGQRLTSTGIDNISKRDNTGSISTLDMKSVQGLPAANVGEVLQGRVSGVMANAFSGDPGAGIQINIRGVSSMSGSSDPLFVVDGMPVISDGGTSLSGSGSSPLSDIPPEEIESVEVLKDASAVALWGSRGANGVVVITTKRGESNKTVVGYSTRLTLKVPKAGIPMLQGDEYKTLMNEADQHRGEDRYHLEVINNLRDNTDNPDFELHNNNTDWVGAIEGLGYIQQHNFSLSGGGNAVRYRFSATYEDNRGPIVTTMQQKLTTKFNLDYAVSRKFSIATNITYTNSNTVSKDVKSQTSSSVIVPGNSIQKEALRRAPTWPIFLQDEDGLDLDGQYAFQELDVINDRTISNPYAFLINKKNNEASNRLIGSMRMVLRPIDEIRIQADLGGDFRSSKSFFFIPPQSTGKEPGDELYNMMQLLDNEAIKLTGRFSANYTKDFDNTHYFNATLFAELGVNQGSSITAGGNNVASSRTPTLSTASSFVGGTPLKSSFGEDGSARWGVRGLYKFMDKYIVNGSVGVDGSSKFGPENRYAIFPTVSLKWLINEEFFFDGIEFVDELALKYSWGISGNSNIGRYTYFSRYSSDSRNSYLGLGGIQSQNIRLDNIRWERTTQNNLGFTAELFNRKLMLDFSVYTRLSDDLIQKNLPLPSTAGYTKLDAFNAGDVLNKGLDFEFDWTIIRTKDFTWSFGGNLSTLSNTIVSLPELAVSEGREDGYYWRYIEGDPLGAYYGYQSLGVYAHDKDAVVRNADNNIVYNLGGHDPSKPFNNAKIMSNNGQQFEGGDAIYADLNNDGVIDVLDVTQIGDYNAKIYGGFNSSVQYKRFSVSMFFMYVQGKDIINLARMDVEKMYDLSNQAVSVRRRWRKQGDITDIPKAAHLYKKEMNFLASDRFVEDGSYLKLQNITLSYMVPKKPLKKLGVKSCRVYMDAKNLLTLTNYTGQDPEVTSKGRIRGFDKALTAPPIMFTLGTSINF